MKKKRGSFYEAVERHWILSQEHFSTPAVGVLPIVFFALMIHSVATEAGIISPETSNEVLAFVLVIGGIGGWAIESSGSKSFVAHARGLSGSLGAVITWFFIAFCTVLVKIAIDPTNWHLWLPLGVVAYLPAYLVYKINGLRLAPELEAETEAETAERIRQEKIKDAEADARIEVINNSATVEKKKQNFDLAVKKDKVMQAEGIGKYAENSGKSSDNIPRNSEEKTEKRFRLSDIRKMPNEKEFIRNSTTAEIQDRYGVSPRVARNWKSAFKE